MNPCGRITIKIFELLGCTACLLAKGITDLEEKRIATRNQKLSREWSLLNNVTWDGSGNTFVNITFGGYLIITALMTIARCIDSRTRPNLLEKILLLLGALMFFACAGLILASLEQILPDLYDNAILLGCLSVFVGLLYLVDLADPLSRKVPTMTQTDIQTISGPVMATKLHKDAQTTTDSYPPTPQMPRESPPKTNDSIDFVEVKQYPEKQSPMFATVRESRMIKQQQQQQHQEPREYPEPWEEFEPSILSKPPSVRSSRAPTQSPDFGYQSAASYVAAPAVDRGNLVIKKARPMMYQYYPDYSSTSTYHAQHEQQQQPESQPQIIKRGYVANAARIWDSRLSSKSNKQQPNSMNTIV